MKFSNYIIYVDESGDHSLQSIDPDYPVFVLSFCIFKKDDYTLISVPQLQEFKFRWVGHDLIILHENEIAKRKSKFAFLQYDDLRKKFMEELTTIIAEAPMTVLSVVVRKDRLKKKYASPMNPYHIALLFCLEKANQLLKEAGDIIGKTHVVCEARSPREKEGSGKEDKQLELEFQRITAGQHQLQASDGSDAVPQFEIVFASKMTNSSGLQIADLIARPTGLSVLRPEQANRAFEIIKEKIWTGPIGTKKGELPYGLKIFP